MKNLRYRIDGMLLASFLTTVFYSATYPFIHKAVMQELPNKYIAINQIINCASVILFGKLWNSYSEKLFKFYTHYCIGEVLTTIGTYIFFIISRNIAFYYMIDTIAFSIVTRNIICGGSKLRVLRYNTEELREHFDNNNNSVQAAATIIGSCIAMWLNLDIITMLGLATFGNIIDNVFYINIYHNTQKKRKERIQNGHNESFK